MTARSTPLFRDQALDSTRRRWLGPVTVVMPPSTSFVLLLAGAVVVMLGVAVASIEIPDRIRTYGVLLPAEGLLKVRAPRAGRVEGLPVVNGDTVIPGQVLLRLSGSHRAPGREPEPAARISSLRRELQLLDESLERQADLARSRERLSRRRLQTIGKRIEAAKAEARAREDQAAILAARADRVGQLAVRKAVAEDVARDSKVAALHGEFGLRREALLRQIAASELQSALEVTAPGGGIVSGLTVRRGKDVAAGDVLMTVYAPQSRLEARLFLSPDNAGMVAVGQRVELQFHAYPYQFFGTRSAVVTAISTIVLPPDQVDADLPLTGPVFVVRARLRHARIQAGGRSWPLAPGTSFQADLVRARWPLYRWLLRSASGDPARS